jgi:hypothetical protein
MAVDWATLEAQQAGEAPVWLDLSASSSATSPAGRVTDQISQLSSLFIICLDD